MPIQMRGKKVNDDLKSIFDFQSYLCDSSVGWAAILQVESYIHLGYEGIKEKVIDINTRTFLCHFLKIS